ncbi:MAG: hypothetical protein AAF125_24795, partial [Chloroflexota bacterium]
GFTYRDFDSVAPGTGVEIIGQSSDGDWLNVLLDNGEEGWMAARLIRIQPTATPFPTVTPTVDETAIALGTVFPTAVIGGGTITPTSVVAGISPTPVIAATRDPNAPTPTPRVVIPTGTPRAGALDSTPVLQTFTPVPSPTSTNALVVDESVLPVIDVAAINATATALSQAARLPTLTPTPGSPITPDTGGIFDERESETDTDTSTGAVASGSETPEVLTGAPASGPAPQNANAIVREGVDVLASCDTVGIVPPSNLAAGSTIDIYWVWYAATEEQVRDHLNAAIYEITIDGVPIRQIDRYQQPIQPPSDGRDAFVAWYAPAGPLAAREHTLTYRVTWTEQIFDGYNFYGPGSTRPSEEGSCTFTVFEP